MARQKSPSEGMWIDARKVSFIYPRDDWDRTTPESQGMSSEGLKVVSDYAQKYGGGSGCVIRHGYLVWEWGDSNWKADIKSATKGAIGTTILGLAVDLGLVSLDDIAKKHYPTIGRERAENVATGWLDEITIRHLATMTAGFDDGRPPKLVYRPGNSGIYSNDTSNMLAELLTLKFGRDLAEVLRQMVMEPLGIPLSDWSWRENAYRQRKINGITSREFASGVKITHRALARVGYLYLRDGNWAGKQILSKDFIQEATQPTSLPAPFPGYGFYWMSNAKNTLPSIPRDTYWALGLGDSMVIVCPSLDLVVVRLGLGSKASQLPGKDDWGGERVARFFELVVKAVFEPPYPPSSFIKTILWAPKEKIIRMAKGSDNWPITWGDDDCLYTAYGDGWGFEPFVPEKLSLGLAKIIGEPPKLTGVNIRSPTGEQRGDGPKGGKASGMLMVDGVLYMLVRNKGNSQIAWSNDRGRTWHWCNWKFKVSFGCPTFLNFGKNYEGARDEFVYIYSPDSDSAYKPADRMVLLRVHKSKILEQGAHEFFEGFDCGETRNEPRSEVTPKIFDKNPNEKGEPKWTKDIHKRGAVFVHRQKCYRSGISYHPILKRYLWVQIHPDGKGLGIYEAPEPWGHWRTVYYADEWDVSPGESGSFPTKWISSDGERLWLVFSGDDSFSVREAKIVLWDVDLQRAIERKE
ncbi:MAG: serine hydrolase [Armatimonadota bacterium]|nr:serine hydrolase [Armatimonadota bacterium]MDW8026475.1 serine hydrolase [Armatimonadota bacterium]